MTQYTNKTIHLSVKNAPLKQSNRLQRQAHLPWSAIHAGSLNRPRVTWPAHFQRSIELSSPVGVFLKRRSEAGRFKVRGTLAFQSKLWPLPFKASDGIDLYRNDPPTRSPSSIGRDSGESVEQSKLVQPPIDPMKGHFKWRMSASFHWSLSSSKIFVSPPKDSTSVSTLVCWAATSAIQLRNTQRLDNLNSPSQLTNALNQVDGLLR